MEEVDAMENKKSNHAHVPMILCAVSSSGDKGKGRTIEGGDALLDDSGSLSLGMNEGGGLSRAREGRKRERSGEMRRNDDAEEMQT